MATYPDNGRRIVEPFVNSPHILRVCLAIVAASSNTARGVGWGAAVWERLCEFIPLTFEILCTAAPRTRLCECAHIEAWNAVVYISSSTASQRIAM